LDQSTRSNHPTPPTKDKKLDEFVVVKQKNFEEKNSISETVKELANKISAEPDYESYYKNDKKFNKVIECPNCGNPGTRVNPKVNSRFFTCNKCGSAYMSQSPLVLNAEDGIELNESDSYRKRKEQQAVHDYIEENRGDLPPNPRLINEYLQQYVVGQEQARRILSVAMYNHYKRIKQNFFADIIKNGIKEEAAGAGNAAQAGKGPMMIQMNPGMMQNVEGNERMTSLANKMNQQNPFAKKDEVEDPKEKLKMTFAHIESLSGKKLKAKLDQEIKDAKKRNSDPNADAQEILLDKSNVILAGPTGTGKTYIAKTLAQALGVPFAVADATSLTAAGYVGEDADTVIKKLLDAADGDVKRAETGIVFIDEIDKIAAAGSGGGGGQKDVGGESVQQALLKIIEGNKVTIKNKAPKTMADMNKPDPVVDTSNILFVGSGAFVGLEDIIARRLDKNQIGFGKKKRKDEAEKNTTDDSESRIGGFTKKKEDENSNEAKYQAIVKKSTRRDELLEKMTADDLQKFGLIPEFIGRMPIRTALKGLTEKDLIRILTEPKNAIVPQYTKLFKMDNVDLIISEAALLEVAKKALIQQTGARGLRSILENLLLDAMYNAPDSNIVKVEITAEAVRDGSSLKYYYADEAEKGEEEMEQPVYAPEQAAARL